MIVHYKSPSENIKILKKYILSCMQNSGKRLKGNRLKRFLKNSFWSQQKMYKVQLYTRFAELCFSFYCLMLQNIFMVDLPLPISWNCIIQQNRTLYNKRNMGKELNVLEYQSSYSWKTQDIISLVQRGLEKVQWSFSQTCSQESTIRIRISC